MTEVPLVEPVIPPAWEEVWISSDAAGGGSSCATVGASFTR